MPYTDALALESIRMFMGRTFGVPHRAVKDTHFMGHFIPKETMMIVNIPSVLMDKQVWGDPENFRPERFIHDGKVVIPDQYLPFGYGKYSVLTGHATRGAPQAATGHSLETRRTTAQGVL